MQLRVRQEEAQAVLADEQLNLAHRLCAYAVCVSSGVEFFGKGTEVPRVDDETADLDRLDVLHFGHFFVLADGGVVHPHFTGVLGLIKLDDARRLLDGDSGNFEFILQVAPTPKSYNIIYNFVFFDHLRISG